jgi:hypothetical protein
MGDSNWESWEKQHGYDKKELDFNIIKICDWLKKKPKKKDFVWQYNHTNLLCDEPPNKDVPYCPKCGGELIRK